MMSASPLIDPAMESVGESYRLDEHEGAFVMDDIQSQLAPECYCPFRLCPPLHPHMFYTSLGTLTEDALGLIRRNHQNCCVKLMLNFIHIRIGFAILDRSPVSVDRSRFFSSH